MNTRISIVNKHSKKDNLVVLAEKSKLQWASEVLNKEEISYLKSAIKKDVHQVVFPKGEQLSLIHI